MGIHTVNALSISKIGELLIEQLGEDAADYTFPEDFEKAVVDIGFSGLVMTGDSSPYDLVVIGNGLARTTRVNREDNGASVLYKKVKNIGVTAIPYRAFYIQTNLNEIDFCGMETSIGEEAFYKTTLLGDVLLPDSMETIGANAFKYSGVTSISGNNVSRAYSGSVDYSGAFCQCTKLKTVYFPKLSILEGVSATRGVFYSCTALENVEVGSIGHSCRVSSMNIFNGCTQSGLTITIYCNDSSNIDTAVANIRNGATNATIIVKAAADLVYDGDSYEAGETVVTSEP